MHLCPICASVSNHNSVIFSNNFEAKVHCNVVMDFICLQGILVMFCQDIVSRGAFTKILFEFYIELFTHTTTVCAVVISRVMGKHCSPYLINYPFNHKFH